MIERVHANVLEFAYLAEGRGPLPYDVIQVPGGHFMHREHPDRVVAELVRVVCEHAPATAE